MTYARIIELLGSVRFLTDAEVHAIVRKMPTELAGKQQTVSYTMENALLTCFQLGIELNGDRVGEIISALTYQPTN